MNNNECDAIILSKSAEKIILALLETDEYQGKLASELLNAKNDIFVGSYFENKIKSKIAAYLQKEYADMFTSHDDILSEIDHICYVTEFGENGEVLLKPSEDISPLINSGIVLSTDILKKIDGMLIDDAVAETYDIKFALTPEEKEKEYSDKTFALISTIVDKHMLNSEHNSVVENTGETDDENVLGDDSSVENNDETIESETSESDTTETVTDNTNTDDELYTSGI